MADNKKNLLQDMCSKIDEHTYKINNLENTTDFGRFNARVEKLETDSANLTQTVADNKAEIEGIVAGNKAEIENTVAQNKAEQTAKNVEIDNKNTEQDDRLDTLETDNTSNKERLTAIENTYVTKNTEQSIGGKKIFVENSLHSDTLQGRLDTTSVKVQGGLNGGASLELKGKANIGNAVLTAFDGENTSVLALSPDGKLMLNDKDLSKGGAGLEVGDIALAPLGIDETDNCRRYLNGQVILQSQFVAFTEKLKHAITLYPNLATTEQNWQSAVTLSPLGQCGKFVINDEAGTIRLPKVVNVMGALDLSTIGQTVEAGLPNITGYSSPLYWGDASAYGAFSKGEGKENLNSPGTGTFIGTRKINFDASRSNSIYGNSETVQQEAIKYPYFIQVATSNSEDVQIDTQVRLNNPFSLFMPYWSPIELNNLSWLRSNKQWNNGAVYTSAYEFLLSKYNAGVETTETISGVSVTYKLADNGMKIITDKSVYDALISASGSAFFFVLDTTNTQFILPYTNGFAQFGGELGKFTEAGLPNIEGTAHAGYESISWIPFRNESDGAFFVSDSSRARMNTNSVTEIIDGFSLGFDASRSSSVYGKSPTVQPNSITGYLYFYVGEVEQDANIIATSGLATDIANLKSRKHIIDEFVDSTSGYRVWSDGWCEQWGVSTGVSNTWAVKRTVTLLKNYKDTNYIINVNREIPENIFLSSASVDDSQVAAEGGAIASVTPNSFVTNNTHTARWKTEGYLAQGEY